MNTKLKYTKWLMMAMVLSMPVTVSMTSMIPAQAAEENQAQEDTLLKRSKSTIAATLAQAGVISAENAEIISNASIRTVNRFYIRADYEDGNVIFSSSAAIMETLKKKYGSAQAAEKYLLQVAEAVAEADMWLRLKGNGNVSTGIFTDWSECVQISVKNLLLKKNISQEDAEAELLSQGALTLQKYLEWNEEKNVFCLKEAVFAADFGLKSADKESAEVKSLLAGDTPEHQQTSPKEAHALYSDLDKDTVDFWMNVKPLDNAQDLKGLQQLTTDMTNKTSVSAAITNIVQGKVVPFEELNSTEANSIADGSAIYTAPTADIQLSPSYVEFCNKVMIPKICEVFEPLAKSVTRKKIEVTVCADNGFQRLAAFGHGRVLNCNSTRYLKFPNNQRLLKGDHFNITLVKFADAKKVFHASPNTSHEAELIIFHLPQAYANFCRLKTNSSVIYTVYAHHQDVNNRYLFSTDYVNIELPVMWYESRYSYNGVDMLKFRIASGTSYKNCIVSFLDKHGEFPYLEEEQEAAEEATHQRLAEESFSSHFGLLLVLLCIFGSICGYAIYILRQEYHRRWKELPLPENIEERPFNEYALRPEFNAYHEWKNMLVWKANVDENGNEQEDGLWYMTDKKTVDKGYAVLRKLATLPDLNEDEIMALNNLGVDLNNVQKRYLGTSKWLLGAFTLCYLFFIAQTSLTQYSISIFLGVFGSFVHILALASIFLADLMPSYKFANEEPVLIRGARRVLKAIGAGTWATAVFMATHNSDTLYRDNRGNVYVEKNTEGKVLGCALAFIILHILILLLPLMAFGNSVASFFRNYFSNK